MDPTVVQCPWCFESIEIWIDPGSEGSMVEDCSVCCRPWQLYVERDADGQVVATVTRAQ